MGIQTGIDLDKLIDAGTFVSEVLGRETRSKVAKAIAAKRIQSEFMQEAIPNQLKTT
jgi:hydroxymethylglutaryl-CoA lyase